MKSLEAHRILAACFVLGLFIAGGTLFAGCATQSRYDKDVQTSAYEQRTSSFKNSTVTPGGSGYDAGNGVVNAATGLAFERNYYQPTTINGRCLLVTGGDPLGVNCNGTILILTDTDRKEIARTQVKPDGSFGFHGEKSKPYYIQLDSKKLRATEESKKPVMVGDTVLFKIEPFTQ